jgi:hypothetical protein
VRKREVDALSVFVSAAGRERVTHPRATRLTARASFACTAWSIVDPPARARRRERRSFLVAARRFASLRALVRAPRGARLAVTGCGPMEKRKAGRLVTLVTVATAFYSARSGACA